MPNDTDSAQAWGGAAAFMLRWALHFYDCGNVDAGDRHALIAYHNTREAVRRALRERDA